jgi:hypothetical protein
MIPPHYRLGSTVVVRPSRFGVVPGSIPGLAILFSSYKNLHTNNVLVSKSNVPQPLATQIYHNYNDSLCSRCAAPSCHLAL